MHPLDRQPDMPPPAPPERYQHHRFPGAIISHGGWLYDRFHLSYRDVAERLFDRGIAVTYEALRQWCRKCGQDEAKPRRRRRPHPGDNWHLDAVFLPIHGQRQYLGRAVDQANPVLELLVPSRRHKKAANPCFRKRLKGVQYVPRVVLPDKVPSSGAAMRALLPGVEPRPPRYRHNRGAHSPRPTRQRERRRQGVTSAGHAQRFLSAYGPMAQHGRPRRPLLSASDDRRDRRQRFERWAEITAPERVA